MFIYSNLKDEDLSIMYNVQPRKHIRYHRKEMPFFWSPGQEEVEEEVEIGIRRKRSGCVLNR